MTINANVTTVNSERDLESLADGSVVLVNVHSRGYSPTTPMLHERITRKSFFGFGEKQGHRFMEVVDAIGTPYTNKAVVRYDIYGDKGISFNEGAVFLEKERVNIGFILPGQLQYQQTEAQLRQTGLYNG